MRVHPVGRETVLVVEDNDAVRKVAVRILRGLGYQVREAADGPSALALLEQPGSIDLLFTDLIMPKGMSGQELLTRAHAIRPDLKALFTSGYSERFIKDKGATQEGVPLLEQALPLAKSCGSRSRRARRVTYIFGKSSTGFPGT